VALDNLAANSQSHACAFVLATAVEALKGLQDPFQIFFVKANAIVFDDDLVTFAG
jgi:hypothetical protein